MDTAYLFQFSAGFGAVFLAWAFGGLIRIPLRVFAVAADIEDNH